MGQALTTASSTRKRRLILRLGGFLSKRQWMSFSRQGTQQKDPLLVENQKKEVSVWEDTCEQVRISPHSRVLRAARGESPSAFSRRRLPPSPPPRGSQGEQNINSSALRVWSVNKRDLKAQCHRRGAHL